MPIRKIDAKHSGFFPQDPMGKIRRNPLSKKRNSNGTPKTKAAAKTVFENPFYSLKEISSKSGISENFLRVSFSRWFGTSFTNYQRVARKRFIEKNSEKSNEWLSKQLGITKSTLSLLIKDLKKEGRILSKGRKKQGRVDALPLEYNQMALEMMRLFVWYPAALSSPEINKITNRSKHNITRTINELLKNNFIRKVEKQGQRTYYVFTSNGANWLRKMEKIRKRKDSMLEKDIRAIPGLIKRKELEKERLGNMLLFVSQKNIISSNSEMSAKIKRLFLEYEREISRLRKILMQKK